MQQRGVNNGPASSTTSMESADSIEMDDGAGTPASRSRCLNNAKLKVLIRSHAMREETSPPRDTPSPNSQGPQAASPCIKLTPSADSYPSSPARSVVVLSPSLSRSASPTSTLVPSPSPTRLATLEQSEFSAHEPKVNKMNKQNARKKPPPHYEGSMLNEGKKCECLNNNNNFHNNNNTLTVNNRQSVGNHRAGKLRQQSSSLGSYESSSPSLSRDNSSELYTDTTGVDLELFIPETLNRNSKDRVLMLRIEEELVQLVKDKSKTHFKFPPMSSYQRMLVHRCAAYFGMDHNIESSGKCVVVNKTKSTRIPDIEFKSHIKDEYTEEPRRSILKRDSNSIEDYGFKSPDRQYSLESRRSKSFEEREEEYEKARRRIFNKGNHECSADDIAWAEELSWANMESDKFRLHVDHNRHHRSSRLLKVQSADPGEETLRPHVAKSYSFGGYGGGLARGDSMMSTHSAGARLFSKQDSSASSVSWRLSPSSSGYKTQSQRSESITPSPTSTPFFSSNDSSSIRQDSTGTNASDIPPMHNDDDNQQVVWAVTNIHNVPKGSVIINPQTGQPIKNHDGSLYHHDPENPLPELTSDTKPSLASQVSDEIGEVLEEVVESEASAELAEVVCAKPPPSPAKVKKERPVTPKKRASPIKKTNSATSPSLPFTPPLPLTSLPSLPNLTTMAMIPSLPVASPLVPSKSFPNFPEQPPTGLMHTHNQYYGPTYDYAQPCIVYAPYGQVPVGFDTRMDTTQVPELQQTFFVDTQQQLTYPAAPTATGTGLWPQTQFALYSNTQPRYAVPVQPLQQPGTFLPTFAPPQTGGYPPPPAQGTQCASTDIIPMYQPQPLIYPSPTSTLFPNTNVIYAQPPGAPYTNAVYPPAVPPHPSTIPSQPTHNLTYPVHTSTPSGQFQMEQMVQSVSQMHIAPPPHAIKEAERRQTTGTPRNYKRGVNSSQSSTENSSPATAVMAYCTSGGAVFHRQNSETPPTPSFAPTLPQMFMRQINNVRASPPVPNLASRSPTPAATPATMPNGGLTLPGAEMFPTTASEPRQRYPLPPFVYQPMPYTFPCDTRLMSGRGQPNGYRQPSPRPQYNYPTNSNSCSSNASFGLAEQAAAASESNKNFFKNRKNRGNKPAYAQYSNNKKASPN